MNDQDKHNAKQQNKSNDHSAAARVRALFAASRSLCGIAFALMLFGTFINNSAAQVTYTYVAAFYYDARDNLLQIEDLSPGSGASISGRVLFDAERVKAPVINTPQNPALPEERECVAGHQNMSALAVYAVYYGIDPTPLTGTDLRAKPLKVEDVTRVGPRSLTCHPGPPSGCTWPPHWCNCGTIQTCPARCCM